MSTITITDKDLTVLASQILESAPTSKQQILNMFAAAFAGPKHDWSWIKNAQTSLLSQRAKSQIQSHPASLPQTITLQDAIDDTYGSYQLSVELKLDCLTLTAPDETQIVLEFTEGAFGSMVYNNSSDGPICVRAKRDHLPSILYDGYIDEQFDDHLEDEPTKDYCPTQIFTAYDGENAFSPCASKEHRNFVSSLQGKQSPLLTPKSDIVTAIAGEPGLLVVGDKKIPFGVQEVTLEKDI